MGEKFADLTIERELHMRKIVLTLEKHVATFESVEDRAFQGRNEKGRSTKMNTVGYEVSEDTQALQYHRQRDYLSLNVIISDALINRGYLIQEGKIKMENICVYL